MKKYIVTLTEDEREELSLLTSKGKHKSQKILNALILLGCDEGKFQKKRLTNREIAQVLTISMKKKEVAYTQKRRTEILKHIWLH